MDRRANVPYGLARKSLERYWRLRYFEQCLITNFAVPVAWYSYLPRVHADIWRRARKRLSSSAETAHPSAFSYAT